MQNEKDLQTATDSFIEVLIQKTCEQNLHEQDLEPLLKLAQSISKTLPDLIKLSQLIQDQQSEEKNAFYDKIEHTLLTSKQAQRSIKSLLKIVAK